MNCCGFHMDPKSCGENFNWKVEETKDGVRIDLSPKDPSKAEALKAYVKACKELCNCGC